MTLSSLRSKSPLFLLVMGLSVAVPAASQTLTVTGGQGQLLTPLQASQPLTALLLSASGQPIVGALVTYTITDAYGLYAGIGTQTVITDSTGTANIYVYGAGLVPGQSAPYDPGTVVATYNGVTSATFYVTTTGTTSTGTPLVTANFSFLNSFQPITGSAGSTSTTPLTVSVVSNTGGVPNIALTLIVTPTTGSATAVTCAEGPFPLTNISGVATCTPVFGQVGTGTLTITIAGANSNIPIPYTVTVGPPALMQITSGNNQSGNPGQQLPLPIVAVVTDLGGNPVPGVSMSFTASPANGATFTSLRQVTDTAGKISANVVLGNVPGAIQITVADTGGLIKNPAVFTETVNVSVTGLTKNTGDGQTAFVNTIFSVPLTVTVNNSTGQGLAGLPVTFAVVSGSATLGAYNSLTNGSGVATTGVVAGNTPGPVVITATTGIYSVTFHLTVVPLGPSNLSFTNGASGAVNSVSPGTVVTIYGTGLANNLQGVTSAFDVGPLPLQLGGVTVQFGQTYAPIYDIGNSNGSQFVTVMVPRETPVGPLNVTIAIPGGGSSTVPLTILPASPGLFTYIGSGNLPYLVAIKANGTVASPTNPANRGETITMYVTGLPLTPSISTNAFPAAGSTASPLYPVILGVANQGAPYSAVAYSPDLQGVETMTFTVPTSVTPGAVQISIGVQAPSGSFYSQGATLNVQ
jgi:uncharacterized protein (TIGR03437 family)